MTLATSFDTGAPLISLAVYCPLLCADKEERAADNILFYFPSDSHINSQMNQVGFCIAISSLAPRFGIHCSRRQTIQKQRSSICLMSPVENLWVSANVRGGNEATVTTHHLLQLSCALFELMYGTNTLRVLTTPQTKDSSRENTSACPDSSTSSFPAIGKAFSDVEARAALCCFFNRCARFISGVLAAQLRTPGDATKPSARSAVAMSAEDWAQYLSAEALFGLPLCFVSDSDFSCLQLGCVEEMVRHMSQGRLSSSAVGPDAHTPTGLTCNGSRCCIFVLPTLHVLVADSGLSRAVVQALKYYLVLCAPITCTSFHCHVPQEGLCEVAVWLDGLVVVVLVETSQSQHASSGESTGCSTLVRCARRIGVEVHQLLRKSAADSSNVEAKDACRPTTRDVVAHRLHYTMNPKLSLSSSSGLVAHWRLRGARIEGTPLRQALPSLVAYVRALMYSTKLCLSSPQSTGVLESWTRWYSFWVFLRFAGSTVIVLVWQQTQHQQPSMSLRELVHEAQRLRLVAP